MPLKSQAISNCVKCKILREKKRAKFKNCLKTTKQNKTFTYLCHISSVWQNTEIKSHHMLHWDPILEKYLCTFSTFFILRILFSSIKRIILLLSSNIALHLWWIYILFLMLLMQKVPFWGYTNTLLTVCIRKQGCDEKEHTPVSICFEIAYRNIILIPCHRCYGC